MYNLDDILRIDKFDTMSQVEILEIIDLLKTELKRTKYQKDLTYEKLYKQISELNQQLQAEEDKTDKYKKVIANYHKMYDRRLTLGERILGKINSKVTVERHKKNI